MTDSTSLIAIGREPKRRNFYECGVRLVEGQQHRKVRKYQICFWYGYAK